MDNADSIKARIIAEFGNGPVTAEADTHLYANGNPIIPDVLCNAGGVIVSYLEMVQNLNMDHWEQDAVHSRLKMHITKTYRMVHNMATSNDISLRRAAAMEPVVEAMKMRGWM